MLLLSRRLPRVDDWVQGCIDWCGLILWGGAGLVVEFHWLWTNPLVLFIGVVDFGLVPTSV